MTMTVNLKNNIFIPQISSVFFFLYYTNVCYFIVNVQPCVTEMNKWFIFFIINIISVQVNQSALLNVLKKNKSKFKK